MSAKQFYAHSIKGKPTSEWQPLEEHLRNVAKIASSFAKAFGAKELGWCAGFMHDIGKFHLDFQNYLKEENHRRGSVDHSSAGAVLADAARNFFIAWVVAAHHGGLAGKADLRERLQEKSKAIKVHEALTLAKNEIDWLDCAKHASVPEYLDNKYAAELFIRLLFSCLVDADYLDTESFFEKKRSALRGHCFSLKKLWQKFSSEQERFISMPKTNLNRIRNQIYEYCIMAARKDPGVFKLTVPTGGGKTRSSLGFALKHAIIHGHDRIIYAIPYTSIIEQTATVFRDILGEENVLEHHTGVQTTEKDGDDDIESPEDTRLRLASENWDFPLVVTTTVQFFESLFANRPKKCRKLHNLVRSVIILDEVQTLPITLIHPIVSVLKELVRNYGVSLVLCTATQPALSDERRYLSGFQEVRSIIPDKEESRYFKELKRVEYVIANKKWSWEKAIEEIKQEQQVLVVVNTRKDAIALLNLLEGENIFHLSTLLCGAHRRDVLKEVKERLEEGKPCRLISTQVVEAGVDLDFPFVLRAFGPLDRIVQVAGRCNREGKMSRGRVIIFDPKDGGTPRGPYRTALIEAKNMLEAGRVNLHDPKVFEEYFERLFMDVDTDAMEIDELRRSFDFPEVARRFRMIQEESIPVIVNYSKHNGPHPLINEAKEKGYLNRSLWRRLQPFFVNIYRKQFVAYEMEGLIEQPIPGLYIWRGEYEKVKGISKIARDPSDLIA